MGEKKPSYEELLTRAENAEEKARGYLGEAMVYRDLLEGLYEAATRASETGNISYLHTLTVLHLFNVTSEERARSWGKNLLYALRRKAEWLTTALKRLEEIRDLAERLTDNKSNLDLKNKIGAAAEDGLITHV